MAGNRKDAIDIIIANVFRYVLLFGLTTHVYDTKKRRLVHSRLAHGYSLLLHISFVVLFPVFYKLSPKPGFYTQTETHFFEILFLILMASTFLSVLVSIGLQWTTRSKAPALFNEILQMWNEDMAHLRRSNVIRRQARRLFIFKSLTTAVVVVNAAFISYNNAGNTFSVPQCIYVFPLFNVIIAVGCQFCCGLVFSEFLFRNLNYNLTRLVEDMHSLWHTRRPKHAFWHKAETLERELSEITRLHAQLQTWVVRFKDMHQVEIMVIMMAFFVLQVFMMFVVFVVIFERWIGELFSHFFTAGATLIVGGLDVTLTFYICGQLLSACDEAGEIMKDLPAQRLSCSQLERRVEMACLQFNRERLRLRICGLVDLDWSKGFAMTEASLMYIILLIQLDFKNFQK